MAGHKALGNGDIWKPCTKQGVLDDNEMEHAIRNIAAKMARLSSRGAHLAMLSPAICEAWMAVSS